jgi:hypothetical protein
MTFLNNVRKVGKFFLELLFTITILWIKIPADQCSIIYRHGAT